MPQELNRPARGRKSRSETVGHERAQLKPGHVSIAGLIRKKTESFTDVVSQALSHCVLNVDLTSLSNSFVAIILENEKRTLEERFHVCAQR